MSTLPEIPFSEVIIGDDSYPGFQDSLDRIKTSALSKNLKFGYIREPILYKERAGIIIYREPRIEPSNVSLVLLMQAGKYREYDDRAWNQIDAPLKKQLVERQKQGYHCFVLQVWQNLGWFVVIPLNRLLDIPRFVRTGHFTVKRDGANFRLQGQQVKSDYLDSNLTPLFFPLIQRKASSCLSA